MATEITADGVSQIQNGVIQTNDLSSTIVFWENAQSLSSNYTIGANKSAMTAGPLTLDSDVTVTLETNAVWVIV